MKKILIADSIKDNRDKLKRSLAAHGFPSIEVGSGLEVVPVNHENVMLVLISQNLQDMSAFDAIDAVKRENPYFNEIPFIICTSDNSDVFYRKCLNAGFKGVLYRPFSRKALFNLIKNIMIEEGIADEDMFAGEEQVEAINEEERIDFLKHLLQMQTPVISPKYNQQVNVGYFYPLMTDFFALEPGEEYDLLRAYKEQNIFSQRLENRVNLCPRCSYHTINLREVCPKCHDLNIYIEEVYHHFTCGYVGPASDFSDALNNQLVCPKCSKQLRHIGLDYEKPTNTYVCHACEYVFNDPQVNFNCFHCGYAGDAGEAVVSSIYSYSPSQKAFKIVEHNSFDIIQLEELISMDEHACSNMEFFNYMLQRDFQAVHDYGDELHIMIVAVKNYNHKLIDMVLEFINGHKKAAETITVDITNNLLMLLPRVSLSEVMARAKELQSFIIGIDHSPHYEACIYVRSINKQENLESESLLKTIVESFEANCKDLPSEIIIDSHDEKNKK